MAGQSYRDDGPHPSPRSVRAGPFTGRERALFGSLCADLERWFPDRFARPEVEEIVCGVLIAWRESPSSELKELTSTHSPRALLAAAVKHEATCRLARDPGLPRRLRAADAHADEAFVDRLFGPSARVAGVLSGMRTLYESGQDQNFRIITEYLNLSYLRNGAPVPAAEVARRLALPVATVDQALRGFRRLLSEQPVAGD